MATSSPGSAAEIQQTYQEQWQEIMMSLYPEALSKTYRVPPEHFFRVPVARGLVPGTTQPAFLLHMDTSENSSMYLPTKKKPRKKKKKKKEKETEPDQNTNNSSRDFNVSTNQPRALESEANQKHEETSRDYPLDQSDPPDRPWSREQASSRTESTASDEEVLWNVKPENPNQQDTNVIKSDLQDDFAQNHVLINLQSLGESNKEVMFIISQLQFKSYGNKPSYAPAASNFCTVFSMNEKYHRGDFDILLIHRTRGILVGELKSVGLGSRTGTNRTLVPREDEEIAKKLRKAVYQLQKSELVLKHLLQEMFSDVAIRKAIFLPYVKTSQLRNVLESDSLLEKELITCFGVPDSSAVLQGCCCYEQLSNPESHEDVADTLENLKSWWNQVMPESTDPLFPDDNTYLEVVGRFVGPASTVEVHSIVPPHVEVRTHQQSIPEFGRRLQRLVLTPQQLDLMERPEPQVCLSGPPGTGKTVMLVLMALRWLQAGHDVYILSTYPGNLAVSFLMEHQLNITLKTLTDRGSSSSSASAASSPGQVYLKFYDVINDQSSVERAIEELKLASVGKTSFHFVMDEAKFTTSKLSGVQTRLFQDLRASVEDLHFWTACMGNEDIPEGLVHVPLTVPLRCAPRVQSLLGPAMATFKIHGYSTDGVAYYVGDGPPVKELYHTGKGHDSCLWPLDCEQCGVEVARELRALTEQNIPEYARLPNSPASLKNKDVFILTRAENLHDDLRDETGNVITHANGAIRGLRQQGIPVTVLPNRRPVYDQLEAWLKEVKDAAVAGTNHVIAAHHTIISGLERKVLVFLPGDVGDYDRGVDVARTQAREKLYVLSRCTTKYIKVNVNI